jgi:nuclear-control-of-ATPase protein 2
MSVLTVQTFLRNHNLIELQDHAAQLLSGIETYQFNNDIDNNDLTNVKNLFLNVYQIVKPVLKIKIFDREILKTQESDALYNKNLSNELYVEEYQLSEKDLKLFSDAINIINEKNWIKSDNLEISGLSKVMILYISSGILIQISKTLIDSTLDTLNEINYYDNILTKRYSIILYFIQTLPINIYDFLKKVKNINVKSIDSNVNNIDKSLIIKIPEWIPEFSKRTYTILLNYFKITYNLINKSIEDFIQSPTAFLLEKRADSKSIFKTFWNSTFKLPYYYSKFQIEQKRKKLMNFQKDNITKLGYLLTNVPNYKILEDNHIDIDVSVIINVSKLINNDDFKNSNNLNNFKIDSLIKLIDVDLPNFHESILKIEELNFKPSTLTRNWPIYIPISLLIISYIPSTLRNINLLITDSKVRNELYLYLKDIGDYIIDTIESFWNNWILNPINNILKTIRHDNNSKIALMTQQSLESDLKSLERMVIDYALDSKEITSSEINQLQESVKSGDLTIVMNNYEKDLKNPIKSIIIGDMLRNIMIQIQKTKVDGSLALNGVDQILKSQELVFGFVAASPSLFILWIFKNSFMSWYNGEKYNSNKKLHMNEIKGRICKSLGIIERLIDIMVINNRKINKKIEEIDYYKNGLLFIEIKNLKRLAIEILPQFVYSNFNNDIEELIDQNLDIEYKLLTIQRIWNVYCTYFN